MQRDTIYFILHLIKHSLREVYNSKKSPCKRLRVVEGDCSHPPLNDDISDVSVSDFSNYDMEYEYDYMNVF